MHFNKTTGRGVAPSVEDFAAELTEAAYRIMLRQGSALNWLNIELELWKALIGAVETREREWSRVR